MNKQTLLKKYNLFGSISWEPPIPILPSNPKYTLAKSSTDSSDTWICPTTGWYRITCIGKGGNGGKGGSAKINWETYSNGAVGGGGGGSGGSGGISYSTILIYQDEKLTLKYSSGTATCTGKLKQGSISLEGAIGGAGGDGSDGRTGSYGSGGNGGSAGSAGTATGGQNNNTKTGNKGTKGGASDSAMVTVKAVSGGAAVQATLPTNFKGTSTAGESGAGATGGWTSSGTTKSAGSASNGQDGGVFIESIS